jgi:hypothetical protein
VRQRRCERPIPFSALVEYWLDDRPPGEPSDIEEHLFGCAECSAGLESLAALGEGVRRLAQEGRLHGGLAPALVDRLERDGRVIRRYRAAAGGHIHCTAGPDDDLVVLELAADLAGVERVDLLHLAADGTLLQRVPQLPVIGGHEVVWASPGDRIRSLPTSVMSVRLMAVEREGERLVGEYTLHHTAYQP